MNISHFRRQAIKIYCVLLLVCLFMVNTGTVRTVQAASGCSVIYNSNGWVIDKCTSDPAAPSRL